MGRQGRGGSSSLKSTLQKKQVMCMVIATKNTNTDTEKAQKKQVVFVATETENTNTDTEKVTSPDLWCCSVATLKTEKLCETCKLTVW